jgi:hypothetical protein
VLELEALCLAILEPDTLHMLHDIRVLNEERGVKQIKEMREKIKELDTSLFSKLSFSFEQKTWDQLKAQMSMGESVATGLSSTTIAIVCPDVDTCYRALGALHQLWKREVLSFQDFINAPQLKGYQGIHTTVIFLGGLRVRCKIRTPEMQKYAHLGIATKCFDSQGVGLAEYVPWSQRISPLTVDTEGSSNDFWNSLKSDILGETMIVHGPDDSTIQVPRNSTALDGAFYLFQERALFATAVKVNGIEVPFSTLIQNAASVDIVLGERESMTRDWLKQVHTAFSAAIIRTALAKQSDAEKQRVGHEMLQLVFTQQRKGYIEEFDEKILREKLSAFGFSSLSEMYAAIADARLEPMDAFKALFERPAKKKSLRLPKMIIRYTLKSTATEVMDRVNMIHRSYGQVWDDISYHRKQRGESIVTVKARMDTQEADTIAIALKNAGAEQIIVKQVPAPWHFLIILLLIALWGLDPILSKMLMQQGMNSFALSFTRAWSVLFFAALLVLASGRGQRSLVRIPLNHISLWIAGVAVLFVNIFTYMFLVDGSPALYNTILRANAVMLAVPLIVRPKFSHTILLSVLLSVVGLGILFIGPFTAHQLVLAAGILIAFNVYTNATTYFQSVARIHARYLQLFAHTSFLAAIASLGLLPLGLVQFPHNEMLLLLSAIYSIIFIGPPYIIFHLITDNFGYATLSPWINATVIVTLIAQPIILHDIFGFWFIIPAAILLTTASLIASKARRISEV